MASTHYARLENDIAIDVVLAEVVVDGRAVPMAERYHPDFIAQLVPYTPGAPTVPPAPSLSDFKAALLQATTAKRWQIETGGITLSDGTRVLTAIEDQNRISQAATNGVRLNFESVMFKDAQGAWVELPLAKLIAVADAVALHVQACFAAESVHHAAISALASIPAAQSYDIGTGWPTGAATLLA